MKKDIIAMAARIAGVAAIAGLFAVATGLAAAPSVGSPTIEAPVLATATVISGTEVDLTWYIPGSTPAGFYLERKSGTGAYAQIAKLGTVSSYANTGLTPNTAYTYRIRAMAGTAYTGYSNELTAGTVPAPTHMHAIGTSTTQVNITWKPGTGAVGGFYIESSPGTGTFTRVGTVGATATSFSHTGLKPYSLYMYRVQAFTGNLCSAYSGLDTTCTMLVAPAISVAVVSKTSTSISWPYTTPAKTWFGFSLERKTGSGAYAQVCTPCRGTRTIPDTGLIPNTTYTYRMYAYSENSDSSYMHSAYSNEVTITTPGVRVPTSLAVTVASLTQLNLTWAYTTTAITAFLVERKSGTGAYAQVASVKPTVTSYANTGLVANTTYTYRVRACNGSVYSDYSNEATALTTLLPLPAGFTVTMISPSQINLSWTKYPASAATGISIERKTGAGAYAQIATVGTTATSYANTGLTANTLYTYRIRSFYSQTYSNYSPEGPAVTLTAPTNLVAMPYTTSIVELSWNQAYAAATTVDYEVENLSQKFTDTIFNCPATTPLGFIGGLVSTTSYTFRVRLRTVNSVSAFSNLVTSKPAAPSLKKVASANQAIRTGAAQLRTVKVTDLRGRRVTTAGVSGEIAAGRGISSHVAPGLYFAQIQEGASLTVRPFAVQQTH